MLSLARLLADLPDILAVDGDLETPILDITSDSRRVVPGALFVAYRGTGVDGHRFIPDALARGAAAVVGEQPGTCLPVPAIRVADGRAALAWLSAAWCGHPSRDMALVGITGTDGKTTTANVLFRILRAAGRRAGLISTVHAVIGDQTYDTGLHTTTPDAPDVQRYLAQMRDAGTQVAVLEATSHGLAQHRVTGCAFDVAVITNITHEHLDFHGTCQAYREAKAMLFRSLAGSPRKPGALAVPKTAVLNRDDSSFEFLAPIPAGQVIAYGLGAWTAGSPGGAGRALALSASHLRHRPAGTTFQVDLRGPGRAPRCFELTTPLIGDFNIYNVLAATGAALALGVEQSAIGEGVRAMAGVPGRMERVDRGQPFTAIVDFAHTPNALARALETTRALLPAGGRVIAVFGCAGLRDRAKRHLMGQVAARGADYTVITAEDPRTEDLAAIMAETAAALADAGRVEGRDFVRIADRQAAMVHAVRAARPGDAVICCGKGHERSMCFGTTEHPWRDADALCWALDGLRKPDPGPPPVVLPTWAP